MIVPTDIRHGFNACDHGVICPVTAGTIQSVSVVLPKYAFDVRAPGQFEIKILNTDTSDFKELYCIRFPAEDES